MKTPFWFLRKNIIAWVLWPLSFVYNLVGQIIYIIRLFRKKTSKSPVICIGGLLAGGVGKTPIVREVASRFGAPVVMRGYGGLKSKGWGLVDSADSSKDIGDEAKMLAAKGLKVYVGDRWNNIQAINRTDRSYSPIIMDDGFQNPVIKKNISILVFDGKIGVGNGFVLPAGPLRESLWFGIARSDAVIIIDDAAPSDVIKSYARILKKPVFLAKKEILNPGLFGKVIPFAGIGYPAKFFDSVSSMPKIRIIESVSFPDHHVYQKSDFVKLFKLARRHDAELVCTEKDWVKFPENIKKKIKHIPMTIDIQPEFWKWIEDKLGTKGRGIEKNSRNRP
ncbi:MAG: tetraacyldisaccharide 4'-kinase [Alphaproteobacteria bacterium]|nr:tetraacyldisaccharide 4'-kinase [Alphaproteobacteria bacterium]